MKKVRKFGAALALLAGVLVAAPLVASADKDEPRKDDQPAPKATKEGKATLDVAAAFRMAAIGKENKTPEALIAAARVIGQTTFTDIDLKESKVEKPEKFDSQAYARELIHEATKMSDSKAIKELADQALESIKTRGAFHGPQTRIGSVSGKDKSDSYSIKFRGGEQAVIIVNNTVNRGDIDLYVYGPSGNFILRDFRTDDDAFASFFVPNTGVYRIVVRHYSGKGVLHYRLTTN